MNQRRGVIAGLVLMLMLVAVSASSIACERGFKLVIENQTTQTLTVYIWGNRLGTVEPGGEITENEIAVTRHYPIMAKNAQGEIVFSKEPTLKEMQYLGDDTFKVVITAQSP